MRLGVGCVLLASLAFGSDRTAIKMLERHGIRPTARSIGRYLRSHYAEGERRREVEQYIALLTHPEQTVRAAAARGLVRLAPAPLATLRSATLGDDPEMRRVSKELGRVMRTMVRSEVLHASFQVIHARHIPGLAREVLRVLPLCDTDFVHAAACDALCATSGPQDESLLHEAMRGARGRTRYAAVLAYGALLRGGAKELLRATAHGKDDHLRLGAARALADLGDPGCLGPLASLLDSDEPWVRLVAAQSLRAISPRRFGYSPFDAKKHRRAATDAWRQEVLRIQTWKTPLRPRPVELGRTLISQWTDQRIIELDHNGNVVWEKKTQEAPWANRGLPDGHRVISFYKSRTLVEYDADGDLAWRSAQLPRGATSIALLPNGNLLASCGKLVELDRHGRIVLIYPHFDNVIDARPMANGNLLVTLNRNNAVVEMTRGGKEVRQALKRVRGPTSAQPLENGNILVCEPAQQRVVEYTPAGEIAWSRAALAGSLSAQRLASGLTMIAARNGVRLVDRDGETRWFKPLTGYLCASRH